MSVADLFQQHFESLGRKSIIIPEIEKDGKPLELFWRPLTARDRKKLREAGAKSNMEFELLLMIEKCELEDGSKAFSLGDKVALERQSWWPFIQRITDAITDISIESVEKNSEAIPSDS